MPNAARILDPVGHSPTMNWLVKGLLIGAAVGLAAVAIAGTGGLAAVAIVGGLAAGGAGIGEVLSTMSWAGKEKSGQIQGVCSLNVFINGRLAARAHLDVVICDKHPDPPPPIAEGSGNVYINSMPAARSGDHTGCGGAIMEASPNVFIGGGTQQTDTISPENLVPGWVHVALFAVGIASALILAGPFAAIIGTAGALGGGMLGSYLGGKWFGEGSDGQKWTMLGGSLLGELRNQMMLNLARDDVRDYRFTVLDKLATDYNIAYFKWDMNRSFSEPGWPEAAPGDERKLWVRYTQNLYSIDRLRAKHPKLEIESCSGGGGRIDLAILKRVDEVWTFDDTEAFDRLRIQEGFTQAYAPKIMSRVGNRCTEYERPHDAVAVPLSCRNARRIRNWRGPEPLDRSRFCAL